MEKSIRETFEGKKVAVVGFGREGSANVDFLLAQGARVEVFDDKDEGVWEKDVISGLEDKGVMFHFGGLAPFTGFDMVVRTPGIRPDRQELADALKAGIPVTSATKIFFEFSPAPIVGVTGTKGKGTCASLIYEMLKKSGMQAFLGGNIGTPALSFLPELTEESVVVLELSSFQLMDLDQSPHIGVVLMVTSEHMDYHLSEEEYAEAKVSIVRFQTKKDYAIVSADYENSKKIGDQAGGKKYFISRRREVSPGCFISEGAINVKDGGEEEHIADVSDVRLPGAHNLENVCAAVMAARLLGVAPRAIVEALRAFTGLPHRLELVRAVRGVKYYNDSFATTPEAAIVATSAFSEPKTLILGGSEKGADFTGLARTIANDESIVAIVGIGAEWPRIKDMIIEEAVAGDSAPPAFIDGIETMKDAVIEASGVASEGDVVLLSPACASFGMFRDYKDRGEQFREAVMRL